MSAKVMVTHRTRNRTGQEWYLFIIAMSEKESHQWYGAILRAQDNTDTARGMSEQEEREKRKAEEEGRERKRKGGRRKVW